MKFIFPPQSQKLSFPEKTALKKEGRIDQKQKYSGRKKRRGTFPVTVGDLRCGVQADAVGLRGRCRLVIGGEDGQAG